MILEISVKHPAHFLLSPFPHTNLSSQLSLPSLATFFYFALQTIFGKGQSRRWYSSPDESTQGKRPPHSCAKVSSSRLSRASPACAHIHWGRCDGLWDSVVTIIFLEENLLHFWRGYTWSSLRFIVNQYWLHVRMDNQMNERTDDAWTSG